MRVALAAPCGSPWRSIIASPMVSAEAGRSQRSVGRSRASFLSASAIRSARMIFRQDELQRSAPPQGRLAAFQNGSLNYSERSTARKSRCPEGRKRAAARMAGDAWRLDHIERGPKRAASPTGTPRDPHADRDRHRVYRSGSAPWATYSRAIALVRTTVVSPGRPGATNSSFTSLRPRRAVRPFHDKTPRRGRVVASSRPFT